MYRILHFADLHLGDPLAGSDESRQLERGKREALSRIVDLALEMRVDALTAGGDLYDQDVTTAEVVTGVAGEFRRLGRTPVLVAPGNHDPYTPSSWYHNTAWPDNVVVFRHAQWMPIALSDDVTLWGAAHDRPSLETNLLQELRLDRSRSHVALLHGWDRGAGPRRGIAHCPFTMRDVERSGAAFVLLGHYHEMRLAPHGTPRYGYPGAAAPSRGQPQKTRYVLVLTIDQGTISVEPVSIESGASDAKMALALAAG